MEITYYTEDGHRYKRVVYDHGGVAITGIDNKTETVRIGDGLEVDVNYVYDEEKDEYIETGRGEPREVPRKTDPEPTATERIAALESENAGLALELAQNEIRFDQMEQANADLLLLLVDKGVL